MIVNADAKACPKCGQIKSKSEFYNNRARPDGVNPYCKNCQKERYLQKTEGGKRCEKHGMHKSKTYQCWADMKSRCLQPRNKNYPNYGGRGITVCERWMSFSNFLKDMGERPNGLTIERVDNNGNYEPSNVVWADRFAQNKNKRYSRHRKEGMRLDSQC